jgi:hypothetical protein
MPVSANSFDRLSEKIDKAKSAISVAASQSEAELKASVDEARKDADDRAAELGVQTRAAADKAGTHWDQIQADWEKHRQSVRQRIDEVKAEEDLHDTELRAEWAEADAADAVEFASTAIDEATYAMLDAIKANRDLKVQLDAARS